MKRLDFLRFNPVLRVGETEGYTSRAGGYLSVFLVFLSLLSFFAFSRDLVFKTNPFSSITELTNSNAFLANKDLFITIAPLLSGGISINNVEQYLDIVYGGIDMDGKRTNVTAYYEYFKAVPCLTSSNSRFVTNQDNLRGFFAVNEASFFCAPKEHSKYDLISTYGSTKFIAWDIQVRLCKNTTSITCKSKEDIQSFLKLFFFQIVISSNLINTNDLESPFTQTYASKIIRVSASASRQDINFIKMMSLNSDEGFLMESINTTQSHFLSRTDSDSIHDENPNPILRLLITNDQNMMSIQRIYIKIQKVAADVGGILKFILMIISALNYLISKVDFLSHVYNRLYVSDIKQNNLDLSIESDREKKGSTITISSFNIPNTESIDKPPELSVSSMNTEAARVRFKKIDLSKHTISSYRKKLGVGISSFTKLFFNYYCSLKKFLTLKKLDQIYSKLYSIESITDSQVYVRVLAHKSGMSEQELHNLCITHIWKELGHLR